MRILKFAASLLLIALASGCSTTEPLIADKFLLISPSVQIFYEALAGATLASASHLVRCRPDGTNLGGARRKLAEEDGYAACTIVSYTEGIESGPLISQRVSRGVVLLTGAIDAAASR